MSHTHNPITNVRELSNYICVITGKPYTRDNPNETQSVRWYARTPDMTEIPRMSFSIDCNCDGPILPYKEKHPKKTYYVGVRRPSLKAIVDPKSEAGQLIKHMMLLMKSAFVFGINEMEKVLPQIVTLEYLEHPGDGTLTETTYEAIAITRDMKSVPLFEIFGKLSQTDKLKMKQAIINNFLVDTGNSRILFRDFSFDLYGTQKLCYLDMFLWHSSYPKGLDGKEMKVYRKSEDEPTPEMQLASSWGIRIPRLGLIPGTADEWAVIRNSNWVNEQGTDCKPVLSGRDHCDFCGRVVFSVRKISQPDETKKTSIKLEYGCEVYKFPHESTIKRGRASGGMKEIEEEFEGRIARVSLASLGGAQPALTSDVVGGTVAGEE